MVTTMRRGLLTGILILLGASVALAQGTVRNPTQLSFTQSDDHVTVTSYVIGYFAAGATDPVQEVDLGKPTPDPVGTCLVSINTHPLAFGLAYQAKVKAVAGTIVGEWSLPSNPFDRVPGKPSAVVTR